MLEIKNIQLFQHTLTGTFLSGEEVYIELVGLGIIGSCLRRKDLRSFEEDPSQVPDLWHGKRVYAWGTIEEIDGEEYVSYLNCLNPDTPVLIQYSLCLGWDKKDFAAYECWDSE